jgi:Protein of unknown function (DUF2934)
MNGKIRTTLTEEQIRLASYLLWEREGRLEGHAQEYWLRAKADLEAQIERMCQAASLAGEEAQFVLPRLPISTPPSRRVATRITHKRAA